jgi:hypothetical protein
VGAALLLTLVLTFFPGQNKAPSPIPSLKGMSEEGAEDVKE